MVGQNGKVFAFEPEKKNYSICKNILKINKNRNILLINKAISNNNNGIKLFLSENNPSDHRTYETGENRKFVEIESVTLDSFLKPYNHKVDFIKMDIQGFEGNAIKGMEDILSKNPGLKIITEFWAYGLEKAGTVPQHFLEKLKSFGFEFYLIMNKEVTESPLSIEKILFICKDGETKNKFFHIDLLCKRNNMNN